MKAAICTRYGGPEVLEIRNVAKPIAKPNEVLIKIHASTVSAGDYRIRALKIPFGMKTLTRLMFGITKPRQPILGTSFSGIIEEIGSEVNNFKVGDEVYGIDDNGGAYAEYKTMRADGAIVKKPSNLTFEDAAAIPFGGATALYFLKTKNDVKASEKILVNGASGAVGIMATQLSNHYGLNVTAVSSSNNHPLLKSLGASELIDYKTTDFTTITKKYDYILDCVGNLSYSKVKRNLSEHGKFVVVSGGLYTMLQPLWSKKVIGGVSLPKKEDMRAVDDLVRQEAIRPVIDKTYTLDQIQDAHTYVDKGHKTGAVVIQVTTNI